MYSTVEDAVPSSGNLFIRSSFHLFFPDKKYKRNPLRPIKRRTRTKGELSFGKHQRKCGLFTSAYRCAMKNGVEFRAGLVYWAAKSAAICAQQCDDLPPRYRRRAAVPRIAASRIYGPPTKINPILIIALKLNKNTTHTSPTRVGNGGKFFRRWKE